MFIVYDERSILGDTDDSIVLTTEDTLDKARDYLIENKMCGTVEDENGYQRAIVVDGVDSYLCVKNWRG